jgi:MraZ protein
MERCPLRHLLLIGEHELVIDEKNRLLIPSEIRKSMNAERDGEAFFLVLGRNRKPWLYAERYYEQMVFEAKPDITPGDEQLDFDHMNFALANRVEWDSQGRLLMPDKTLRRTELSREVTLIGARDHLEIWNRSDWDSRREQLLARSAEVAIRAKQARQAPSGNPTREIGQSQAKENN